MSTPHPREAGLEALLRQQRSDVAPGDACLDAETLAAWAEGGLDDRARATAEAHAAGCARCQALVATIVRTEPEPTPAVGPSLWDRLGFRWLVPLTAAAAAVLLWIAVPPSAPDRPADTLAVSQPAPEANAAANRDRAAAPAGGAASGAAQPPAAPTAGTGAVGQRLTGPGAATAPGGGSSPAAQAKAAPAEALRVEPAAHPAALRQPAPERRLDAPADRASARNEA
ncbi:MAG: hypothetical protein OEW19_16085, partial [Acidobacteriota bacterium]|nr:hypothetical protein [Acidobacteriota bacterium]